eukprot:COSAG01_NODE_2804_length_7046_cov_1030.843242_7_plen_92_part_00
MQYHAMYICTAGLLTCCCKIDRLVGGIDADGKLRRLWTVCIVLLVRATYYNCRSKCLQCIHTTSKTTQQLHTNPIRESPTLNATRRVGWSQ